MSTPITITIDFDYLEQNDYPSVTDYCRFLVKQDEDWSNHIIEVYRRDTLCLTVTDIYKAATVQPTGTGWTTYDKRGRKRSAEGSTLV